MKRKLTALALGLVLALGLAACGGGSSSSGGSASGGDAAPATEAASGSSTVVVAMGSGFATLDPGRVYEKYPPLIVNACYENLFKF